MRKIPLKILFYLFLTYAGSLLLTIALPLLARLGADWLVPDVLLLRSWELFVPLLFPWLIIYWRLRPALTWLNFKNNNMHFFLGIIVWLGFFVCGLFSQQMYTQKKHPRLHVESVKQLESLNSAYFFTINKYNLNSNLMGHHTRVARTDKGRKLEFTHYTTIPFNSPSSSSSSKKYWLGIMYTKRISSQLPDNKVNQAYNLFIKKTQTKLKNFSPTDIEYLERINHTGVINNFHQAIENATNRRVENDVVLLANETPLNNRYFITPLIASITLGLLTIICLITVILTPKNSNNNQKPTKAKVTQSNSISHIFSALFPKKNHIISPVIINVNLLVFIVMSFSGVSVLSPEAQELLAWGGNRQMEVISGEWWRLVTSTFIHAGILHLLFNMFGLYLASLIIEPIMGYFKTCLLYFLSGLIASLSSIYWHDNTISVGASGAIFGLFGAILILLPTKLFDVDVRKHLLTLFGSYVILTLTLSLFTSGDNAAHLGGLFSGAFLSFLFYQSIKKPPNLNAP